MLNVVKCPHCRRLIETNLAAGQQIDCPHCEAAFTISRELVARRGVKEALSRLAIPVGYVLFVAVPLGLTVWYFAQQGEKSEGKDAAAEKSAARAASAPRDEKNPPPVPRPRKEKHKDADPGAALTAADPTPAVPAGLALALAPAPREVPEVFVAPGPHEVVWRIPLREYSSKWQTVGAVDIRVAGLAVTKVPIVDRKERVSESAAPLFVVLVEVRSNAADKPRTLTSWTNGMKHYAAIFSENGKELSAGAVPPGGKPNTGLAYEQPLPPDGTPARDVLLFAVPPAGAGELSLRLEAERCGEFGDVWFKIPATALRK